MINKKNYVERLISEKRNYVIDDKFYLPGRWINCYEENQKLDAIISLLPKLRDKILYFEETKKLYDKDIVSLTKFLYEKAFNIEND